MSKHVRRRLVLLALVLCAGSLPATAPGHEVADLKRVVSAVGTLEMEHYDDFDHGRAVEFASLRTRTGSLALAFDHHPSPRLTGSRVFVEGVPVAGRLQVRRLRVLRSAPSRPRQLISTSATTVRVAVLLVNFANDPATPFTRETARGVILTNADSAAAYFREASSTSCRW